MFLSKHASPVVVYLLLIPVSFFVSFYLVSQGVSFIYRIVYQCRIRYIVQSGLAHRVLFAIASSPGVEHDIVIGFIFITQYIHRILVFLYLYIFYIHRIHHIHYIHQSTSHATIAKQAAVPPLVQPSQIGQAARDKSDAAGSKEQATMSKAGTLHERTPRSHMMTRSRREHR